jgi:hypothetical protein
MPKLEPVNHYKSDELYGYRFVCPGCNDFHMPVVNDKQGGPQWDFNGDLDRPTFSPSLLMRWSEYRDGDPDGKPSVHHICHSFIRDGRIEFLGDCTHHLANQEIELPEVEG